MEMGAYRAVMACFVAVVLASCATTTGLQSGGVDAADDMAFPPNYRELIVQTIWARTDARSIRSARISQPRVLWLGLIFGGHRRAICVEVIRETFITSNARDLRAITFKDGRVERAINTYACEGEGYLAFDELLKQS